jgi:hypothetical protein
MERPTIDGSRKLSRFLFTLQPGPCLALCKLALSLTAALLLHPLAWPFGLTEAGCWTLNSGAWLLTLSHCGRLQDAVHIMML